MYRRWSHMKERCADLNRLQYGGRGISVCDRWKDNFENFLADMGEPDAPGLSLERIFPDRNYEPANVIWACDTIQLWNKGKTHKAYIDLILTLEVLCTKAGLDFDEVFNAFRRGERMLPIVAD
jgi:hypothetical protein